MSWRAWTRWSLGGLLCATALLLAVPLYVQFSVSSLSYTDASRVPSAETAIVLGASVYGDEPSPILAKRADLAAELFLKGKVKHILVSGDDSPYHDEVSAVVHYLEASGIPEEAMILDREGYSTFESMLRARSVYKIDSAIVVTQSFHMPRALFLARGEGMQAVGAVASGGESQLFFYLREIPATWKALFDLAFAT